MDQLESNNSTTDPSTPSEDFVPSDQSNSDPSLTTALQALLDLGLPPDTSHSKLTARLRPLARDLLLQLDPQDAAERMLVVQMIASFSRSMFLSRNANNQKQPKWFALYSNECDRAMTLFRRQMQTLTDLRRPRRTTFNAIRQANIAGQQIVMNTPEKLDSNSNATNAQPLQNQKAPPKIPPHPSRPNRSANHRQKK